jgi:hypothetical protein
LTTIRTLHKIHAFVEAQQNGSKVKSFFRQGEMSTLLKECKAGLQQGFAIFQVGHLLVMQQLIKECKYVDRHFQYHERYYQDTGGGREQT